MTATAFRLADVAPIIAAARDAFLAQRAADTERRRYLRDRVLHLQWLVAHRDLQAVRALQTRNRKYIGMRQRKLEAAKAELACYQRELDRAEKAEADGQDPRITCTAHPCGMCDAPKGTVVRYTGARWLCMPCWDDAFESRPGTHRV